MLLDIDYNASIKIGPSGEYSNKIKAVYKIIEPNLIFSEAVLKAFAKWIELEIPWDLLEYAFRFGKRVSKPKYFSYYETLIDDWWSNRNIRTVEDALEFTHSTERQKEREKYEAQQKKESGRPAKVFNTYFPEKVPGREFIDFLADEGEDGTRIGLMGGHDYLLEGVPMEEAKKLIYDNIDTTKPLRIGGLYVPKKIKGMENILCLIDRGNNDVDICLLGCHSINIEHTSLDAMIICVFGNPYEEKPVAKPFTADNAYVPVRKSNSEKIVCMINTKDRGLVMGTITGGIVPIKGKTLEEAAAEYEACSEVKPAPITSTVASPKKPAGSSDEALYRKLEDAYDRLNNPEWKKKQLKGSTKPEGYANQMKAVNSKWDSAYGTIEPMCRFFMDNIKSADPKPLNEMLFKNYLSVEAVIQIIDRLLDFYNKQDNVSPILNDKTTYNPKGLWAIGFEYMNSHKANK